MRKFIIGLIAFVAVICIFWVYTQVVDTVPLNVSDQPVDDHLQIPQSTDEVQRISDTKIIEVGKSRYVVLDPETKETKQIFGFEKLLNPGKETSRRKVLKPYIIFYEPTYECRVDSDSGTFVIEMAGNSPSPKDAQLSGNVVIHLTPKADSKLGETSIYMDDLVFSSERSEFATEGPVKIVSKQMTLNGQGLILIFDTERGRVEYMRIRDLETLHVKNVLASGKTPPSGTSGSQAKTSDSSLSSSQTTGDTSEAEASADYYECVLEDNVLIEYGGELVVSGAQRVNIQNILFSSEKAEPQAEAAPNSDQTAEVQGQTAAVPDDRTRDVVVRCDGGIILRPMQDESRQQVYPIDSELSVEMSGTPLRIDRIPPDNHGNMEPLVYCGLLEYRPEPDILRLFTGVSQPEIVLEAQQSRSRIQTSGNVFWDRKNKYANIAGPGTIYFSGSDSEQDPSEIAFDGMMDLLFAEPLHQVSEPAIQTINFSGGFSGILKDNGIYKTRADSARLDFGLENVLSKAHLLGGVLLESLGSDSFKKVLANSATFYFEESQVKTAELEGQASFDSEEGRLSSTNIEIQFDSDETGATKPVSIKAVGDPVLETGGGESRQKPAKFEANRINYNLQSGSGVALGPIRFTFYQNAGQADSSDASNLPIVVTADKNAEFVADQAGSIREIVFNENVLVTRRRETSGYQQLDNLHGDALTVYLDNQNSGQGDISRITMTKGDVFAESIRTRDDEKLFHSRIYCDSMVFDQINNTVLIQGPGEVKISNSQFDSMISSDTSGLDFRRPCYAFIEGFDEIQWDLTRQKITAGSETDQLSLAYVPLKSGIPEKYISFNSRQFELDYDSDSSGGVILKRVKTGQAVIYTEKDQNAAKVLHTVTGQTLTYDSNKKPNWLVIQGSENNPCYADGWRYEKAYINIETGEIKTSLSTLPGVIGGL